MDIGTDALCAAAAAAWTSEGVCLREEGNSWMINGDRRCSAAWTKAVMCSILYLTPYQWPYFQLRHTPYLHDSGEHTVAALFGGCQYLVCLVGVVPAHGKVIKYCGVLIGILAVYVPSPWQRIGAIPGRRVHPRVEDNHVPPFEKRVSRFRGRR